MIAAGSVPAAGLLFRLAPKRALLHELELSPPFDLAQPSRRVAFAFLEGVVRDLVEERSLGHLVPDSTCHHRMADYEHTPWPVQAIEDVVFEGHARHPGEHIELSPGRTCPVGAQTGVADLAVGLGDGIADGVAVSCHELGNDDGRLILSESGNDARRLPCSHAIRVDHHVEHREAELPAPFECQFHALLREGSGVVVLTFRGWKGLAVTEEGDSGQNAPLLFASDQEWSSICNYNI